MLCSSAIKILTDQACPQCGTPHMRSPDKSRLICVLENTHMSSEGVVTLHIYCVVSVMMLLSAAGMSVDSAHSDRQSSRPSTPPSSRSIDGDSSEFSLPPPSAEMLRRRQQSDLASSRIGQKMLQGYAMLADECQNIECFGVPLVRPPRRDGRVQARKVCLEAGH